MFNNKKILITGGSGSWGNELIKQLETRYKPSEIIIYSRGELAQVEMSRKFSNYKNIKYVIGDVRDLNRLLECTRHIDYVFHLAALKHVPICEQSPWESVQTNIEGTENVIKVSLQNKVKMVIDVSTDKACHPINVYGSCKSVGEKLIIQANQKSTDTKFVCVRAGNVMGTNGSIIPFFKKLVLDDKKIPITDEKMTRYFILVEDAIGLLFKATEKCYGGEIYVTKMPSCKIINLAEVISNHYNKKLNYFLIGKRPGEKLHEELVSEYESIRTVEDSNFRIILPEGNILDDKYKNFKKMSELRYTSNDFLMNNDQIEEMLIKGGF